MLGDCASGIRDQETPEGRIMTLRRFALLRTPAARTSGGLALLALLGLGIASANTEAVVTGRFTAALEAAPRTVVADNTPADKLVAGSEAYWLERRRHDGPDGTLEQAAWQAAPFAAGIVSIGDRITVSNAKGDRILEVVAVTEVPSTPSVTHASGTVTSARKIAITCRDLSTPDSRLITFEAPIGIGPGFVKSARTL